MSAKQYFSISEEVKYVLKKAEITSDSVRLSGDKLDRKLYTDTNKILEEAGGKWDRKTQMHKGNTGWTDKLISAIEEGKISREKVIRQSFFTPEAVADRVVEISGITGAGVVTVLEPSCGDGSLIRSILKKNKDVEIDGYEIDNNDGIKAGQCGANVTICDFLEIPQEEYYDFVFMNPPFTSGQDKKHILHALGFLKSGGTLVAIVPSNFDVSEVLFGSCVVEKEEVFEKGAFSESGTQIETKVFVAVKN